MYHCVLSGLLTESNVANIDFVRNIFFSIYNSMFKGELFFKIKIDPLNHSV